MRMICLALCGAFTLAGGEVWLRDGARLPGEIKLADGAVEVGGRRVPAQASAFALYDRKGARARG